MIRPTLPDTPNYTTLRGTIPLTKQEKRRSSSYWPSSTPNRVGEKRRADDIHVTDFGRFVGAAGLG